jgi:primosomal protein N' (replication factor Y)
MYGKKIIQTSKIPENITILGPVEAPIFLLRGQYRFRILIKGNNRKILNRFTRYILKKCPVPPSIKLVVDVDPYSFM